MVTPDVFQVGFASSFFSLRGLERVLLRGVLAKTQTMDNIALEWTCTFRGGGSRLGTSGGERQHASLAFRHFPCMPIFAFLVWSRLQCRLCFAPGPGC